MFQLRLCEIQRVDEFNYAEVYEAVNINRASRVGQPASFSDMAWCLASLTEILIKADYYGADLYRKSSSGSPSQGGGSGSGSGSLAGRVTDVVRSYHAQTFTRRICFFFFS